MCVCVFMGMLAWGGLMFTEFCLYETEQTCTEANFWTCIQLEFGQISRE
jgi:hypothetical protein